MSNAEIALVTAVVVDQPDEESKDALEKRAEQLALVLRRTPEAIRAAIGTARETLQSRAIEYADIHLEAARAAAKMGNDQPSRWALTVLTAPSADGKGLERIVEPPPSTVDVSTRVGLIVNINSIPIGGFKEIHGTEK